jgi:hypothetical protein
MKVLAGKPPPAAMPATLVRRRATPRYPHCVERVMLVCSGGGVEAAGA